ncbi:MAG: HEAT repeat domain-containing protein, partial [Deltaproteobacteria bacterium]|nr:HEAT repeat domain-containing protein [Deltaproteobacteria bacterium]
MKKKKKNEVDDRELKQVIADFLDQGHVENIISMFRHEPRYYGWTGELLTDERFSVRLGISVLFEELVKTEGDNPSLAILSLIEVLESEAPLFRGEAVSLLGTIGTETALS